MKTQPLATRVRQNIGVPIVSIGLLFGAFAVGAAFPTTASASGAHKVNATKFVVKAVSEPTYGFILTDAAGYTLYGYHGDTKDNSTVTGNLLVNWPPLIVPPGDVLTAARGLKYLGKFTLPTGQVQVTWHGKPLYTFIKDTTPDVVNGEGKASNGFYVFQVKLIK